MSLIETQSQLETGLLVGVLEASTDSVEIDDIEGRVVLVNDAWRRLFDREKQDVTGVKWENLGLGIDSIPGLKDSWERCISGGRSEGSLRLELDGAPTATVPYVRSLFREPNGNPRAAITIFRSTPYPPPNYSRGIGPERTRSGEGRAALEHKMKNVLTTIVLNVDLVHRAVEDRMVRQRIALVQSALKSGLDLLNELAPAREDDSRALQ